MRERPCLFRSSPTVARYSARSVVVPQLPDSLIPGTTSVSSVHTCGGGERGRESCYCCTLLEAWEDSPAAFIIPLEGSSNCSPVPATPAERFRWSSPGGAWRAAAASVWRASLASRYARLLEADMLVVRGKRRGETKKIKHGRYWTFSACLKDDSVVAGGYGTSFLSG